MKKTGITYLILVILSCGKPVQIETILVCKEEIQDTKKIRNQLEYRFNKILGSIQKIEFQNNKIKLFSTIEYNDDELLFEHNQIFKKFEFKIISSLQSEEISKIDKIDSIEGFKPHSEYEKGFLPKGVIGTTTDPMKFETIRKIIDKTIEPNKSFWSKDDKNINKVFYLYVGQSDEKHIVTSNEVDQVSARISQNGEPELFIQLNNKAKDKFSMMTEKAATSGKQPVHFIINDKVVISPMVFDGIYSGSTVINGNFSEMEVIGIMKKINLGNLDIEFEIESQIILNNDSNQ